MGRGVDMSMHMTPDILNYSVKQRGTRLRSDMILAIEPMLTANSPAIRELDNGWTVITRGGSRAAQWEHAMAVISEGVWVLITPDSKTEGLAPYGIEPGVLG